MRWLSISAALLITLSAPLRAADPADLPKYDLKLTLDTVAAKADFTLAVSWTNRSANPTRELAFNFYPNYRIPEGDHLLLAKTLELLRMHPSDGIDRQGRQGTIHKITQGDQPLTFHYRNDNPTAIAVELPGEVKPGETITVVIDATIRLPNKQGRWGQWQGVSFLTNALPVLAFFDDAGWHQVPFVPWHQPFWNEAGVYTATIKLPIEQKLACSAAVATESLSSSGWKTIVTHPFVGRDFAILSSAEYQEYTRDITLPSGKPVTLKCLAFAKHEFYAKEILRIVGEAIPIYSAWFGEFPYSQMTIAESFFGWNGNECAGLIMIDERVFGMPHLAVGYVEYLVSHETCHQWWYNLVGTNGYAETFMDEGAATFFTHKLLDAKHGKNNEFMTYPKNLEWLPNIRRENYRNGSLYGAIRRDDAPAAAGDLPGFNHLVGLFSGAYDRGSKAFGMIEARLGEAAFLDFTRGLVTKYGWRVLSAAQYQKELEEYTGQKWGEFFDRWIYGKGLTDWSVESVITEAGRPRVRLDGTPSAKRRTVIVVRQSGELDEPTSVGISFRDGDNYPLRIPVNPSSENRLGNARLSTEENDFTVTPMENGLYSISLDVSSDPVQVAVDPDRLLVDKNPGNNLWKSPPRVSIVPLYTTLNETDLTTDYDRWNLGFGPWIGGPLYSDPWYTRSTILGARAAAYRTQTFAGGFYGGYRTDYRDIVIGADGLFDHYPLSHTQIGYNVEQRVAGPFGDQSGRDTATRASLFGRYVLQYGSSFYLPPLHYVEAFTTYQDNFLPESRTTRPGDVRPTYTWQSGIHHRLNLNTPYWDPECGLWVDLTASGGLARLQGKDVGAEQLRGELAVVKKVPWNLGPLTGTRLAARLVGMGAFPDRGQFYALGGGTLFRGFDLAERQGSALWVANVEFRMPLARDVEWDALDHTVGARNVWLATFYDVGDIYSNGKSVGGVAHALGAGVRVDLAIFSFIERATLRFDAGKTINASTPWQFWFGVQHAF